MIEQKSHDLLNSLKNFAALATKQEVEDHFFSECKKLHASKAGPDLFATMVAAFAGLIAETAAREVEVYKVTPSRPHSLSSLPAELMSIYGIAMLVMAHHAGNEGMEFTVFEGGAMEMQTVKFPKEEPAK